MSCFIFLFILFVFLLYFVPFKLTHLRYNTLILAFFSILETLLKSAFWYRQQVLFWFFFYLLNRSKTLSFQRWLQFSEEENVSGDQVPSMRYLRHDYIFVFCQKLTSQISIRELVRYHGAQFMIGFSTILGVSDKFIRTIGA